MLLLCVRNYRRAIYPTIVVRYLLHKEQQIALVGVSMLENAEQ